MTSKALGYVRQTGICLDADTIGRQPTECTEVLFLA
jgi:hypothetical protein